MTDLLHASPLDAQVDTLLLRVTRDRDRRCDRLRAKAAQQAREIVRSGGQEARSNVHAAVLQERARLADAVRQVEARAELELRQQAQRDTRALLEFLWKDIEATLEARWRDPDTRLEWARAALREAADLLDSRSWRIESPTDWSAAQREVLRQVAAAGGGGGEVRGDVGDEVRGEAGGGIGGKVGGEAGGDPGPRLEWVCIPTIQAGMRVRSEGVCLDATVAGLLANRAAVESEFLAAYLAIPDTEPSA